ncbi:MAG TPA: hypothetical protein DHV48_00855 [Prolixibacteraceae bacterium]|nr:hypothetical protein [Prolixibacteraceae bacterium]
MRNLSFEQMEEIQGRFSWNWSACFSGAISGGLMPVIATAWNPWLVVGVMGAGCVAEVIDYNS